MIVYCQYTRIVLHVSLLGTYLEAAAAVFLYVYAGVGMRMTCTWA